MHWHVVFKSHGVALHVLSVQFDVLEFQLLEEEAIRKIWTTDSQLEVQLVKHLNEPWMEVGTRMLHIQVDEVV